MILIVEKTLLVWLVCALMPIGIIGYIAHDQTSRVAADNAWLVHSHVVREQLDEILNLLNTAETSARGYVITGNETYLEPYLAACPGIAEHIKQLGRLIADNPEQVRRLRELEPLVADKLDHIGHYILVRREKGLPAAAAIVSTQEGQQMMEKIRRQMQAMQDAEGQLLQSRKAKSENDTSKALNVIYILTVFGLMLVGLNVFFARLR